MDEQSPPVRIYHPIAPDLLDADVVKVVRRLRRYHHEAYLVGGCVRDLLLGVTPKDFDVATGAPPREIRRIFRNSKVVGRRFRLAHIFFRDGKVIEVATFRRSPSADKPLNGDGSEVVGVDEDDADLLITDDNLFGTPEEDARRRDFTINGLFYDLHTREIVDHVHGLPDIEARMVRAIGDPAVRIQEDPVRILRAIKFASRLGLNVDPPLWEAMIHHRREILRSAPPRVLEEIFRLLRCPHVLAALTLLQRGGQLEILLPEVHAWLVQAGEAEPPVLGPPPPETAGRFWRMLALLDTAIAEQGLPPDQLILAVLLFPMLQDRLAAADTPNLGRVVDDLVSEIAATLHLPRRDSEHLRQIFITERRLAQRRRRSGKRDALLRRPALEEALFLHELSRRLEGEPLDRVNNLRRELGPPPPPARRAPAPQHRAGDTDPEPPDQDGADFTPGNEAPSDGPRPRRRRRSGRRHAPQSS